MNNKPHDPQLQSLLLGYHLGLTDAQDSAMVESAFPDSAERAEATRRIQQILSPLDQYELPPARSDLASRIMAAVDAERGILKFPTSSSKALPTEAEMGPGAGPVLPLRELIGLAAAVLLFVGILVPGYRTARNSSQRAICADNMRQLGVGYQGYAEANSAFFPFVAAAPQGASWVPTQQGDVQPFSNSQHAWLLVKHRYAPSSAFVCPSRPSDSPMTAEDVANRNDFPSVYNNSYTTNLMTAARAQQEFQPANPLAADMTPLLDQDRNLISDGQIPLNSASHGNSRGQNVLRANLGVNWSTTPNVGVDSDDIYRVIGIKRYTGQERPQLRSDAFLVP